MFAKRDMGGGRMSLQWGRRRECRAPPASPGAASLSEGWYYSFLGGICGISSERGLSARDRLDRDKRLAPHQKPGYS